MERWLAKTTGRKQQGPSKQRQWLTAIYKPLPFVSLGLRCAGVKARFDAIEFGVTRDTALHHTQL